MSLFANRVKLRLCPTDFGGLSFTTSTGTPLAFQGLVIPEYKPADDTVYHHAFLRKWVADLDSSVTS